MYRNFEMPADRCKEMVRLAEAVIIASGKVRQAQVDVDEAKEAKLDTRTFFAMLRDARKEGRQALVALDEHKEGHQCKGPLDRSRTNWSSPGWASHRVVISNYSWRTAKAETPIPGDPNDSPLLPHRLQSS
jgi:hypothetical protein